MLFFIYAIIGMQVRVFVFCSVLLMALWQNVCFLQRKSSFFSKNNRTFWLKVFGNMAFEPDSHYNRHNHFQTFMAGLLVLFRWVSKMQLQTSPANFPHPQTPKIKFLPQCTIFSVPRNASIKYKWQWCGALSQTNFECSPLNVMFSQYNFSLYYFYSECNYTSSFFNQFCNIN